jgi:hypothetical protein
MSDIKKELELRPCPFCGNIGCSVDKDGLKYECLNCSASAPFATWNTRPANGEDIDWGSLTNDLTECFHILNSGDLKGCTDSFRIMEIFYKNKLSPSPKLEPKQEFITDEDIECLRSAIKLLEKEGYNKQTIEPKKRLLYKLNRIKTFARPHEVSEEEIEKVIHAHQNRFFLKSQKLSNITIQFLAKAIKQSFDKGDLSKNG